ncbi:helix-turn-helix transcriptional regulator [Nisaea acidiphila]|uniref:Helix-turn-helix transcriptional regulator n=1 Tax=Nisaea acidiphila TaxID=1862145 RepID=A0A9J7APD8_9PROT|nr:helix-turn-helix domain-containing protein [Nisaea acidiphila]UUX48204.1 helix-turn-helix transcriptional regulator [Nisaea acidiphila]
MENTNKLRTSGCPVAFGLDIFGDRWSLLIIRDMMLHGKKTYGDFLEGGEGISTNILAARLKQFEAQGIVAKSRDPDSGRSYLYHLTDKGRDLAPILFDIILWSGKYDARPFARKGVLNRLKEDRPGMEARVRSGELAPIQPEPVNGAED